MKIFNEHFGQKLRLAIKNAGLRQAKFAELVGVEPPAVSRWVNGIDLPEESRLPKLCEVLKVSESYFAPSEAPKVFGAEDLLFVLNSFSDVLPLMHQSTNDPQKADALKEIIRKSAFASIDQLQMILSAVEAVFDESIAVPSRKIVTQGRKLKGKAVAR